MSRFIKIAEVVALNEDTKKQLIKKLEEAGMLVVDEIESERTFFIVEEIGKN